MIVFWFFFFFSQYGSLGIKWKKKKKKKYPKLKYFILSEYCQKSRYFVYFLFGGREKLRLYSYGEYITATVFDIHIKEFWYAYVWLVCRSSFCTFLREKKWKSLGNVFIGQSRNYVVNTNKMFVSWVGKYFRTFNDSLAFYHHHIQKPCDR